MTRHIFDANFYYNSTYNRTRITNLNNPVHRLETYLHYATTHGMVTAKQPLDSYLLPCKVSK